MPTVEDKAVELVMDWERKNGRNPVDVRGKGLGYDIKSESASEKRCVEVKSRSQERQTFVTMDGGLLKRLGKDVSNYYLYFVRNVENYRPTLRIVPAERVLSNLATTVRFKFAITKETMEGIKELPLSETETRTEKFQFGQEPKALSSIHDPITNAIYEFVRHETGGNTKLLTSTQVRDEMARKFPARVKLRKHIRHRLRKLVSVGLAEERRSTKGQRQKIFLYRAVQV